MSKFSADKSYALFDTPASRKIISELKSLGAKTLLFPAVETEFAADNTDFANILLDFDWLVFTDIYTVEFFLQKLEEINFDLYELDNLRVCAYGESVADRLRYAQLHADVIPSNLKTETVLDDLKNYLFNEELSNSRFLIFKEKTADISLIDELKNYGSTVSEILIYKMNVAESAEIAKNKSLLRGGAADEFIFTSPQDVTVLAHYFPNENLQDILEDTALTFSDNITRQSLEEFRLI